MGATSRSIPTSKIWGEFILIFICVGSREYQFNRLLREVDRLVGNRKIDDKVFAQIGKSTYIPRNYSYIRFLDQDEFSEYQHQADLIISHGGTGALIGALKLGKQVIAVPRLEKFDEHIDNHQTEVAGILEKEGYLRSVIDINDLLSVINCSKSNPQFKIYQKPSNIITMIEEFIKYDL